MHCWRSASFRNSTSSRMYATSDKRKPVDSDCLYLFWSANYTWFNDSGQPDLSSGVILPLHFTSRLRKVLVQNCVSKLCFTQQTHTTTTYKPRLPPKRQPVFAVISLLGDPSSENHRNIHISTTTLTTEATQPWPSVQTHPIHPHQLVHLREKQHSTESSRM